MVAAAAKAGGESVRFGSSFRWSMVRKWPRNSLNIKRFDIMAVIKQGQLESACTVLGRICMRVRGARQPSPHHLSPRDCVHVFHPLPTGGSGLDSHTGIGPKGNNTQEWLQIANLFSSLLSTI